jgi:drug/metabolite transporter (DMT)-like permease
MASGRIVLCSASILRRRLHRHSTKQIIHCLQIEPLLAVILWGGVYPGAKLGLREIPMLSFTALRILVAMILLFVVSGSGQTWRLPRSLWPLVFRAGLAQTTFQLLLIAGLQWTTAGNSAILLATAPLLTAGWLTMTGRAALGRQRWMGLVVGLVGVGFVVHSGLGGTWAHLGGDVLALGATGAWAWYGLVIGPLVKTLGAPRATDWTMVVAAWGFTPLALREVWGYAWWSVSWEAWAGLLYGATVGMVMAMVLWGKSIHRLGPQQTMLYVYLEPVSAVLIAAIVLGEALHPLQTAGALLPFVGVGLASDQ